MKVSIFGNTNNYPLRLANVLNSLGVETRLYVNRKELLHRPKGNCFAFESSRDDWIVDVSTIEEKEFIDDSVALDWLVEQLNDCDWAILNHIGPSLAERLEVPFSLFMTGSDLSYYANYDTLRNVSSCWSEQFKESIAGQRELMLWEKLIDRQRQGIRRCVHYYFVPEGITPKNDRLLEDIGVARSKRMFFILVNPDLVFTPMADTCEPVILCGARLNCREHRDLGREQLDNKQMDIMIRGLGEFHRETGNTFELVLVEKGDDVSAIGQLIDEEGLSTFVKWKPEMDLESFYGEVRDAHIVFDQLGLSMPGMTTVDALTIGRPVIANSRSEILTKSLGVRLPIYHADDVDSVVCQLKSLWSQKEEWNQIGRKTSEFMANNFGGENVLDFIDQKLHSIR